MSQGPEPTAAFVDLTAAEEAELHETFKRLARREREALVVGCPPAPRGGKRCGRCGTGACIGAACMRCDPVGWVRAWKAERMRRAA